MNVQTLHGSTLTGVLITFLGLVCVSPLQASDQISQVSKMVTSHTLSAVGDLEGWVELRYWVSETGILYDVEVTGSSDLYLEAYAINWLSGTSHPSYTQGGVTLPQAVTQHINFSAK
jgi:hypothetical protein